MYLQQDLLDQTLSLKFGRLSTEDDFLASPVYGQYVSAAINSVPGSILESTPGFSTFPGVQWGAVAAYKPLERVRTAFGVYSSDDDINKDKEHGIDFSLDPDNGVMAIGEVDCHGSSGVAGRRRACQAKSRSAAGTTPGRARGCATRRPTPATTAVSTSVCSRWRFATVTPTAPKG